MMKKYEEIEHTADLAVRVYGKTVEELFQNAAFAMMDLLIDLESVKEAKEIKLVFDAQDKESLIVKWLSEILYYVESEKMVFKKFKVKFSGENHIESDLKGEGFDSKKHDIKREIKAVTYHNLEIKHPSKDNPYWQADIIFDV